MCLEGNSTDFPFLRKMSAVCNIVLLLCMVFCWEGSPETVQAHIAHSWNGQLKAQCLTWDKIQNVAKFCKQR